MKKLNAFKVIQGGIFSSIQDQGRRGYGAMGIRESGAMDKYAYNACNLLLGQRSHNAIEIMTGLVLEAQNDVTIALCGADLDFRINVNKKALWQSMRIQKGDRLSFSKRVSGQRAYLAVKGGFDMETWKGSFSVSLKDNFGDKLKIGDILTSSVSNDFIPRRYQKSFIPQYPKKLILRVILSYQENSFAISEKNNFFNSSYTISLESDRMGYKLIGKAINPPPKDIISEGIAFGAIQIPKDGQPIVLLSERQTIGGYAKIGSVLAIDCYRLAQMPIGSKISFTEISLEEAQEKMKVFLIFFK